MVNWTMLAVRKYTLMYHLYVPRSQNLNQKQFLSCRHELVSPNPKAYFSQPQPYASLCAPCSLTACRYVDACTACTPCSVDRVQAQLASTEGLPLPCSVDWCPGDAGQLRAFAPWTRVPRWVVATCDSMRLVGVRLVYCVVACGLAVSLAEEAVDIWTPNAASNVCDLYWNYCPRDPGMFNILC